MAKKLKTGEKRMVLLASESPEKQETSPKHEH